MTYSSAIDPQCDISTVRIQEFVDVENISDEMVAIENELKKDAMTKFVNALYHNSDRAKYIVRFLSNEDVVKISDTIKDLSNQHMFEDNPIYNIYYHLSSKSYRWKKKLGDKLKNIT